MMMTPKMMTVKNEDHLKIEKYPKNEDDPPKKDDNHKKKVSPKMKTIKISKQSL